MFVKQTPSVLLSLAILLAACDSDPLSQRGKVYLPDNYAKTKTASEETSSNGIGSEESVRLSSNIIRDGESAPQIEVTELEWDDLLPVDWRPDPVLIEKYNAGEVDDDDPRIIAIKRRISDPNPPANKELDDKLIKLPGFVVPLEADEKKVSEFLLVPYHGACIHVPPPPSNQTVFVKTKGEGSAIRKLFDTVWVTGRLKIEHVDNDVAQAGYTLYAEKVETFD